MLNVAIVYHFIPNYRQGVFSALEQMEDIQVTFVAGHSRPGQEHVPEADGITSLEVENKWFKKILWQKGLGKALRDLDPDVVIFLGSWTFASTWFYGIRQRLRGQQVLFWTHGWKRPEKGPRGWFRILFYRIPHALLLYGNQAKVLGLAAGFDEARLQVIGNSLAIPSTGTATPEPPISGHILWVARLVENKRLDLLIDALTIAVGQGHDLTLTVVGDGPDSSPDVPHAIQERTSFLGAIHDEEQLAQLFRSAQVVAIPASAGLTILHSLSYGTPVIVDDDPNLNGPEHDFVEPDFNGSTFEKGNPDRLAVELVRWTVESPADRDRREQIAESAIQFSSPQESALRILEAIRRTAPS